MYASFMLLFWGRFSETDKKVILETPHKIYFSSPIENVGLRGNSLICFGGFFQERSMTRSTKNNTSKHPVGQK